jgi:16S rRNA (cytidine1402-2'-O)-methyltransferase
MSGKLLLVSLPLGNLQDVTLRALQVLQSVDYILAEDTREMIKFAQAFRAQGLLNGEMLPSIKSYRDQTHARVEAQVIADLQSGMQIALCSDRGTPTISDPGYLMVRAAIAAGITVEAIPGPSSAIAALTISGLPTDRFTFLGFLPRTPGKQRKLMQGFADLETTLIIFESPFRVVKLLESIQEVFGEQAPVAVCRELTKMHEEVVRGPVAQVLADFKARKKILGEFVICVRA